MENYLLFTLKPLSCTMEARTFTDMVTPCCHSTRLPYSFSKIYFEKALDVSKGEIITRSMNLESLKILVNVTDNMNLGNCIKHLLIN